MTERGDKQNSQPTIYDAAKIEAAEIKSLIPPRGSSAEVRMVVNTQVRSRLSSASDIALAMLTFSGHDLSRREFLRRMRDHTIGQIEAPFLLMESVSISTVHRDDNFQLAHQEAVRCAPAVESERMADLIERFQRSSMERDDRRVFADVLSVHQDMNQIVSLCLERFGHIASLKEWIMEIKEMADQKKAESPDK